MPTLISIQVGKPQERPLDAVSNSQGKTWTSGIFKAPVSGRVWVGSLTLAGDGQADLKNHGGKDRVALLYAAEHYAYWREVLPEIPWVYGGFGENLTVSGLHEDSAFLGDIYAIGDVRLQVTQPRQPCWKLAKRWQQRDLTARVASTGYSGWYVRTLREGEIEAGMPIELIDRPYPQWSINQVRYVADNYEDEPLLVKELAKNSALSANWRDWFAEVSR